MQNSEAPKNLLTLRNIFGKPTRAFIMVLIGAEWATHPLLGMAPLLCFSQARLGYGAHETHKTWCHDRKHKLSCALIHLFGSPEGFSMVYETKGFARLIPPCGFASNFHDCNGLWIVHMLIFWALIMPTHHWSGLQVRNFMCLQKYLPYMPPEASKKSP